jgi:hypothetical protein
MNPIFHLTSETNILKDLIILGIICIFFITKYSICIRKVIQSSIAKTSVSIDPCTI